MVDRNELSESLVRVSLASFGGFLSGYGLQARQEQSTTFWMSTADQRRYGPPQLRSTTDFRSQKILTARRWGLACFFFAFMLEASRLTSPTSTVWNALGGQDVENSLERKALTATADYTLGGLFAGIASSRAFSVGVTRSFSSSYFRGGFYGSMLGFVGGIFQAALVVVENTMDE